MVLGFGGSEGSSFDQLKSKEEQYLLNTILFSGLYNLRDVPVGYFTIYTLVVQPIALFTEVCAVDGQGNLELQRAWE